MFRRTLTEKLTNIGVDLQKEKTKEFAEEVLECCSKIPRFQVQNSETFGDDGDDNIYSSDSDCSHDESEERGIGLYG